MKLFAIYTSPDGLRGITTPLPEKPRPTYQCYHPNCYRVGGLCSCERQEKEYPVKLQAAKDASILMEDQRRWTKILRDAEKSLVGKSIHEISEWQPERDKVYSLPEPLEAEQIWQYYHEHTLSWKAVPKGSNGELASMNDPEQKHRRVLRISQGTEPDTRLKTGELVRAEEEGSEPTCNVCNGTGQRWTSCGPEECWKCNGTGKIVVEEKKEPEKLTSVPSYQEKGAMKHINEKRTR